MRALATLFPAACALCATTLARAQSWSTEIVDEDDRRNTFLLAAALDVGAGTSLGVGLWGVTEGWVFGDWYFRLRGGVHVAALSWRGFDTLNGNPGVMAGDGGSGTFPELDGELGIPVYLRRVEVRARSNVGFARYSADATAHQGVQLMAGARLARGDAPATALAVGVRYGRKVSTRVTDEHGTEVSFLNTWWVQARGLLVVPGREPGVDLEGRLGIFYAVAEWVAPLGTPREDAYCDPSSCQFSTYPWSSLATGTDSHLYVGLGLSLEWAP